MHTTSPPVHRSAPHRQFAVTLVWLGVMTAQAAGIDLDKIAPPPLPPSPSPTPKITANAPTRPNTARPPALPQSTKPPPPVSTATTSYAIGPQSRTGDLFADRWQHPSNQGQAPRMAVIVANPPVHARLGSPASEAGRDTDEEQHNVTFTEPFALSETEVTLDQWQACVSLGGCSGYRPLESWKRGTPATYVSWPQAQSYAAWLNKQLDLRAPYHYRLPSEVEWELAARGTNTGPFGFAKNANISPQLANYRSDPSDGGGEATADNENSYQGSPTAPSPGELRPAGSYPPNRYGLRDMHGNAREWVADCYAPYSENTRANRAAAYREAHTDCEYRVVRGGSWGSVPANLRSAFRGWHDPNDSSVGFIGFRLARTLPRMK